MQPMHRSRTKSGKFFKCRNCGKSFRVPCLRDQRQGDGSTTDCPHCGELLIIKKGKTKKFHKWMHEADPRWPKDGEGTGCICL